jgi:hypothetical protein
MLRLANLKEVDWLLEFVEAGLEEEEPPITR